jgi:hypothetical protein
MDRRPPTTADSAHREGSIARHGWLRGRTIAEGDDEVDRAIVLAARVDEEWIPVASKEVKIRGPS